MNTLDWAFARSARERRAMNDKTRFHLKSFFMHHAIVFVAKSREKSFAICLNVLTTTVDSLIRIRLLFVVGFRLVRSAGGVAIRRHFLVSDFE